MSYLTAKEMTCVEQQVEALIQCALRHEQVVICVEASGYFGELATKLSDAYPHNKLTLPGNQEDSPALLLGEPSMYPEIDAFVPGFSEVIFNSLKVPGAVSVFYLFGSNGNPEIGTREVTPGRETFH